MICNGVVKDDKTVEVKVSLPFEAGQRVSLLILPYAEARADSSKSDMREHRLSSDEVDELERILEQDRPKIAKQVRGTPAVDVARIMRALPVPGGSPADIVRVASGPPHVPHEDIEALERATEEGKGP